MYAPGTVLRLDCNLFYHYGICDSRGKVIHNSKKRGQVCCEDIEEFSEGFPIEVSTITSINPAKAVVRARSKIGAGYYLFSSNCEHFVRWAHSLESVSVQLQSVALYTIGVGMVAEAKSPEGKLLGVSTILATAVTPDEVSPLPNLFLGVLAVGAGALAAELLS